MKASEVADVLLQVVGSVVGPGLWMLAGRPAAGRSCQQGAESCSGQVPGESLELT